MHQRINNIDFTFLSSLKLTHLLFMLYATNYLTDFHEYAGRRMVQNYSDQSYVLFFCVNGSENCCFVGVCIVMI